MQMLWPARASAQNLVMSANGNKLVSALKINRLSYFPLDDGSINLKWMTSMF